MNAPKEAVEKMYELWLDKNYPYYTPVVAIVYIVLVLAFCGSLISAIWWDHWWKMTLSTLGGGILIHWFAIFYGKVLVQRWKDELLEKKRQKQLSHFS